MQYEQTDVIKLPRPTEPRALSFQIPDDASAFEDEGYDSPSVPTWGFSIQLDGKGEIRLQRADVPGFWVPLLLSFEGGSLFEALHAVEGVDTEELALGVVKPLLEFSPVAPPEHLGTAAAAQVVPWFARMRAEILLDRTPVGHLRWPHFALTLEPRGEGATAQAALTLVSGYVDGVLTFELGGRTSTGPAGDWAPALLDRAGIAPRELAAAILAPLLQPLNLQPQSLIEKITDALGTWVELSRWSSLPA